MAALPAVSIGDVFLLRCTHCNPPKMKYYVVVHVDPLKMFIINSTANDFQQNTPSIIAALAPMFASEHPFLKHDSLIGCHHLSHEYSLAALQELLARNPKIFLGQLSSRAKAAVSRALRGNEHLPQKWLRQIRIFWNFD